MFPTKTEDLPLHKIADYWSRDRSLNATKQELQAKLEEAWLCGDLVATNSQVRLGLLRYLYKAQSSHFRFLPHNLKSTQKEKVLRDGSVEFDPRSRIPVPDRKPTEWTDETCKEAYAADSHKNAEVRRGMQPLVQLGEQARAAILGITHLSKGTAGRDPIERITGSLAFAALPRLIWGTAKSPEPGRQSRLVRVKSNIGPGGGGFEYCLIQTAVDEARGLTAQAIQWGEILEGSAKSLIAELEGTDDPARASALDAAKAWLVGMLGTGTVRVPFIEEAAKEKGHAWPTVMRAKTALGVVSLKQGSEGWAWQMPKMIKA